MEFEIKTEQRQEHGYLHLHVLHKICFEKQSFEYANNIDTISNILK